MVRVQGLDVENYVEPLEFERHRMKGTGVHSGPYPESWNGQWRQFIRKNKGASKQEILDQLAKMRKAFGI